MFRLKAILVFVLVATLLLFSSFLTSGLADGGANHRVRNLHLGVSGGNVNDATRRFCCSGTLGALVSDGTNKYILSNNHVLGRGDQAVAGEDISQPGLIDNNCAISTIVADYTGASPLGSNVDAAVAQLRTGLMDGTGSIEDIGVPSSTVVSPSVGLGVENHRQVGAGKRNRVCSHAREGLHRVHSERRPSLHQPGPCSVYEADR